MSSIGTGYDLSCTSFSPNGHVFQVEYASKAVDNSGTSVGIWCLDGVVLGVEKLIISPMIVPGSGRRVFNVAPHIGMSLAGLTADQRQIVVRARSEASQYLDSFAVPIPPRILAERVAAFMHAHGLYWHLRPFGVAALVAGYDATNGPELYILETAGVSYRYTAVAIGKGRQAAKTELEKLKFDTMTVRQAVKEVARIIHNVHDSVKDKDFELDMSWICAENGWRHQSVPKDILAEADALGKSAINEDSDDDA